MIRTRGLKKTYASEGLAVQALRGVDLDLAEGEFVAVMGPSGSGKSTLMHILGCMDRPSAGSYKMEGRELAGLEDDDLSALRNRMIGFVFQNFNLLPRMTALENTILPMAYSDLDLIQRAGRAERALKRVGLADRMDHLPSQLSGGQQQRVAIARALVMDPRLLVADEPTGNLDTKSADSILDLFDSLNDEGRTVLLVTHDPKVSARCRRVLTLTDGRVVTDRRLRALRARPRKNA